MMVLEGIVTTLAVDGRLNIAPMGARMPIGDDRGFVLRPYPGSRTHANLKASREGVLHVTDNVLMLARAAVGQEFETPTRPAQSVNGRIVLDACRFTEFRVLEFDDEVAPAMVTAEVVHQARLRDFFGLNRAKHAVVEAAILATRVRFLPAQAILDEIVRLRPLIHKTGGPDEHLAFDLLADWIQAAIGLDPGATLADNLEV